MKRICWILITAICLQLMPYTVKAAERPHMYLYDDFEGIQEGRHPLYKNGYWSGDTLKTNYCGYIDAVNTDDTKKLRIHTKGAGERIASHGPYLYVYLNNISEDIVFEADITAEDMIGTTNLWMRGATASHLIKICNFDGGVISTENTKICEYVPGQEYHLTAVMSASRNTMTVSIDDITVKDVAMGAPLVTPLQTLRFSFTGSPAKDVEAGVLFDNVKVYSASEKLPDDAFKTLPQNLGLHDWTDLTKFMQNNITFVKQSKNTAVGIDRRAMDYPAHFDGDKVYAPVKFVLDNLNIPFSYTNGKVKITLDAKTYILSIGDGLKLVNGIMYIDLKYLTKFGGLYLSVRNNVALFGRHLAYFNNDSQATEIEDYVEGVEEKVEEESWFPTREQIEADFAKTSKGVHPRVLATKDDFDRIRQLLKTNPEVSEWYAEIKRQADYNLTLPPFTFRTTDGLRMDTTVITRFETLGMVYNIEGGEKYFKKAYEDMKTIVEYETWQPTAFILLAGMLTAMAIGYDWFYNAMSPSERKYIADGMYRLGLKYALDGYRREVEPGATDLETRSMLQWLNDQSNWTAVGNGGAVMGAVALYDEFPEDCNYAIWSALQSIENFYATTEPDGGNTEGIGYWWYSSIHYTNLVAVLMSALGTDYGRYDAGGIYKSGYFPIYMQNEVSAFTFSDTDNQSIYTPLYLHFALRNKDNGLGEYRKNSIRNNISQPTAYDLLWYREKYGDEENEMGLDYYFRNVESGSFRDTFNNDFSTFLAFHGGSNTANHAHADGGTWAFYAHGEKWFVDLGKDNLTYTNPTGIQFTSDQLYRIRTEGHNCAVFNPDKSSGQSGIFAEVESFHSGEDGGYAIMDLSNVYNAYVDEYKRGFMLTDNRTRAVIQDKFKAKAPSEYWWFAHTMADVEILPDGKGAVLTQNGRKLAVYLTSKNPALKLGVMKAEPLPTSPIIIGSADNSSYRKLFIHASNITEAELAISLVPIVKGESIPRGAGILTPLEKWSIKERNTLYPELDSILIDGEELPGFNPGIFEYMVKLPFSADKIPEVRPVSNNGFKLSTEGYEENLREVRKMTVTNEETGEIKNYYVTFMYMPTVVIPDNLKPVMPVGVTASDVPQPQYPPENTIDGSLDNESRWSALNEQHLIYDLGEEYSIDKFALSMMKGTERQSPFEVYTSTDGENYDLVLASANSKMTDGLELFRMKASTARYVKVQFHGADVNPWNSVKEIKIYKTSEKYTSEVAFELDFENN